MSEASNGKTPLPPLDLDGLPLWLVTRGMRGLPLTAQWGAFCQRVFDSGFPITRVQMGMYTLHPRYGSHTFVWRPDGSGVQHIPRARAIVHHDIYLKSPVHFMRSRGLLQLRRRLDSDEAMKEFVLFPELRAEGLVDYVAQMVPYDLDEAEGLAQRSKSAREPPQEPEMALDGIFFSCATSRPEGFDDGHLAQVLECLPYFALAAKSRMTYDVANTVLETYLGPDAGRRVLTGAIERGSAQDIRAVIWFADLRGFTSLTDRLPRELLVATLNDYLEAMAAPIQAHNGQILKFMGDGLLATFDLTGRAAADVCQEALTAAAELRAAFPAFNEARAAAGKPVMDFGLALHLGEVLYGNIGAIDRLDFTVIGPAVNEASRIQSLCRPLERNILVSGSFQKTAANNAPLQSLGNHPLRGVREPQELFGLSE